MDELNRRKLIRAPDKASPQSQALIDDLSHIAARICKTPVALIALGDESQQWLKSAVGLSLCEVPRIISFCYRAIKTGQLSEIHDTWKDKRLCSNPLVVDKPHIRFYASVPVVAADGQQLGILCVIDFSPRKLNGSQRDSLVRLARQIVGLLEPRLDRELITHAKKELQENTERTEEILNSALDAVITMSPEGHIISWNRQAEIVFGWKATEVIGRKMSSVIIPPALRKAHDQGLQFFAKTGTARVLNQRLELTGLKRNGEEFPVELTISQIQVSGKPLFSGFIRDLTSVRKSEIKLKRTSELLTAVGQLQSRYISGDGIQANDTFDALLKLLLKVTGSEYGFVAEVLHDEKKQPYLKTHAITDIAWNEEMRAFYRKHKSAGLEFRNLETLFGAALVTGKAVIANSPGTDSRRGGLPPGHPPMDSFLGVPIKRGDDLIAMVGAANRPGGYDLTIVEEMEPLLSTYATLIRGFQFTQQREDDRRRIEQLNSELEVRAMELSDALEENRRVEQERRKELEEYSANLERRVAERTVELVHSQRQFKDLFNYAPDALVMTDQSGSIQLANLEAERIFGWTRRELLGMPIKILLPSLSESQGFRESSEMIDGALSESLQAKRKDGREFPVEIKIGPFLTVNARLTTVAIRDLSERIQLEQEIARISSHEQERLAHDLHDHLGSYLAGIAFRLKTMAEGLRHRSIPEASDAQQLVRQVNQGIDLARNFARLLAPVDLASGGLKVGLGNLAREMEKTFNLTCKVKVSRDLPELTQEQRTQLYRVAQEAIRNAIQHGEARLVSIELYWQPSQLVMTVSNDGKQRRDGASFPLGLGLRIMQHRIASLGGTFTLQQYSNTMTEARCVIPLPKQSDR